MNLIEKSSKKPTDVEVSFCLISKKQKDLEIIEYTYATQIRKRKCICS